MTVTEAIRYTKLQLEPVCGEESLQQAKILVGDVLGVDENVLLLHGQMEMTREQLSALAAYIARRERREPLQYIIRQWSFMGLPFLTDARALIPRQDTETLVETALSLVKDKGYRTALDLCCGSGCIGISLAKRSTLTVTCADVSEDCVALTRENAVLNEVDVTTVCCNLFDGIRDSYDMILCNPPYLTSAELRDAQPELAFEPVMALDGGTDGLAFYRRIADQYARHLNPGGTLLLEIGATQADAILRLFLHATIYNDVCGNPRVAAVACL